MKPGNFVQLTIKLNQERRTNVFESASTDGKVEDFTSTLISILNTTMPLKTVRMHRSDKQWMTTRIKLIKIKERQISCYTNGDMQRYQLLREEVSSLVATAKANYYQNKASGLHKTDPVLSIQFYLKSYRMHLHLFGTMNYETSTFPIETADGLRDDPSPLPSIGQVKFILKTTNSKKATGSDGIPAWLTRNLRSLCTIKFVPASDKNLPVATSYKHES